MSKKMRLTPEEKQTMTDCCNQLKRIPRTLPNGDIKPIKVKYKGLYLIENYRALQNAGIKTEPVHKINPNQIYTIDEIDMIDPYSRMIKALKNGTLKSEVAKHIAETERYYKRQAELNSEETADKGNNTGL